MAKTETQTKFVVEYKSDDGKLEARWHYDYSKTKFGPVLVEHFDLPPKEKKSKRKSRKTA